MYLDSSKKTVVDILEAEQNMPRPSQDVVGFLDDLLISPLRYLYLLYLYNLQYLPRNQGNQLICICLTSILMRQLSSNKHIMSIYIVLYNHLFPPTQLTSWILLCIHSSIFGKDSSCKCVCHVHPYFCLH